MRRILFLILALLLMAGPAQAYEILVLQSGRNPVYEEILRGFRSACALASRTVILSDYAEVDVPRLVKEDRPRIVVALGDDALAAAKKVRQVPVLGLMTLGLNAAEGARGNVTGIDLFVPPDRYMNIFKALKMERIGVLYNPSRTGWYIKRAAAAAQKSGLKLVAREVRDPRETLSKLADLKGKVDAIWMVPDSTAVVKEVLEAYFDFSLLQHVPVVSFTAAHLRFGAAAVIDIDRNGLGRQAGEVAIKLLNGAVPADLPVASPGTAAVKANGSVLKNLGLPQQLLERLTD